MGGTNEGGRKAAKRNKELYGDDYYKKIGSAGGKASGTGGFAAGDEGRERARIAGRLGGAKSRRKASKYEFGGEMLTRKEIAKRLGVSLPTIIYRLRHHGNVFGIEEK